MALAKRAVAKGGKKISKVLLYKAIQIRHEIKNFLQVNRRKVVSQQNTKIR
jgi:hypothetical protein